MSQFYFDPSRENETHALPDAELFYVNKYGLLDGEQFYLDRQDGTYQLAEEGWYYWACFPGCLPDGDPIGPFETEDEAMEDARDFD